MAFRMMSAILPSTPNTTDNIDNDRHKIEREKLLDDLLAVAKKCHVRFGGRAELATESENCIVQLCNTLELIFSHGLRSNCIEKIGSALRHVTDLVSGGNAKSGNDIAFWPCIKEQLTWHEQDRFTVLKNVHTDYGRGRAWLRAVLNERSLERHLHSIINPDTLSPFYEEWAFLLDQEKSSTLPNIAAGLGTILFAIRVDYEELDNISKIKDMAKHKNSQSELIISSSVSIVPSTTQEKQKKKIQTHIISFDNEDEEEEKKETTTSSISAAPTSLNSPITFTNNSASLALNLSKSFGESSDTCGSAEDKSPDWQSCSKSFETEQVLTPINDVYNMGNLVPVLPLETTLDEVLITLPNHYIDDATEVTETTTVPSSGLIERLDIDKMDVDSLKIRLLALNELLEQTREDATSSRLQLARIQRQHQNYLDRHELQLQTLNRENELLRQQLRKYVTAVQMLRKDSISTLPDEPPILDDHNEAQQYEEKLIQVAEMHAELMEFNARLTMQLNNRNQLVKVLQAELECLRGPISECDLPSEPPCLIHIWIPSAFLTGQSSDIHHVYQIYVRIRDTEWNIYRRYAQFHALYRQLKKHDNVVTTFDFPPKKTIGNKDAKFVEERRQKLQQWLRQIVGRFAQCSPAFSSRPCKQTFINLLPFFSDNPENDDPRKNNSTTTNTFPPSSQYMGL